MKLKAGDYIKYNEIHIGLVLTNPNENNYFRVKWFCCQASESTESFREIDYKIIPDKELVILRLEGKI